jgi:hypothetical protein
VTTGRNSGSKSINRSSHGGASRTSRRVAFAVRVPSGWYHGTTFHATSW